MENAPREKDPAAVALGKRRIAKMTPEEQRAFHQAGAKAAHVTLSKRSPLERRMSGIRAWRTRRMRPAWMRKPAAQSADSPGEPPAPTPDTGELARLLDGASDEALERLRSRLVT